MRLSEADHRRLIHCGRSFIEAIEKCDRRCGVGRFDTSIPRSTAVEKASHLWAATEGRTIFDPSSSFYGDEGFISSVGEDEIEELQLLCLARACVEHLLHDIGYLGGSNGFHGNLPTMAAMKGRPQEGLAVLPALVGAVDDLERLIERTEKPTVRQRSEVGRAGSGGLTTTGERTPLVKSIAKMIKVIQGDMENGDGEWSLTPARVGELAGVPVSTARQCFNDPKLSRNKNIVELREAWSIYERQAARIPGGR